MDAVLREGISLAGNGKWEQAVGIFRSVIAQSPDYDVPHFWLGRYLERTKDLITAIDALCASAAQCRRKHHLLQEAGELALFKLHDIHGAALLFAQAICVMIDRPKKNDFAAQRPFLFMGTLFKAYWYDEGVSWAEKAIGGGTFLNSKMLSEIDEIIQSRKIDATEILEEVQEIGRYLLHTDIKKENAPGTTQYAKNKSAQTADSVIAEIIESIKNEEVLVFCGAGISRNSGLPVVGEIVPYILDKLGVQKEHQDLILDERKNLKGMPFELFMEIIYESGGIGKMNDIYDAGEPNVNHILISELIKKHQLKTVVTTNFDQLIEKALAMGPDSRVAGRDYDVLYKSDDIGAIDWSHHRVRLIKIHGSVHDKKNMAITMRQVAGKQLSMQRKGVIDYVYSSGPHKTVLIFGYSCSDSFDISPHIQEIKGPHKKVLLVEYAHDYKLEDIREKRNKNPFGKFDAGKRFYYNFDDLVKKLWNSFCEGGQYNKEDRTTPWRNHVDNWHNETMANSKANAYLIPGLIFYNSVEFKAAGFYYERAITAACANHEKREEGIGLCNMGNVCFSLGEHQKATSYFQKALPVARETGDEKLEGIVLVNLATIHKSLGEYKTSVEYCGQALVLFRHRKDIKGEATCLGNLGTIYGSLGEYQKSTDHLEKALALAQTVGDKHLEASSLDSLGISYVNQGQHRKAMDIHEQSLMIEREIGNKQGEIFSLCNLGDDNRGLGEYHKALHYHEQALKIALYIADKHGEAHSLISLGNDYVSLGEYPKAIDYYKQAQQIAQGLEDKDMQGGLLGHLGNAYFRLREYRKATECYQQSMDISLPLLGKNHPNIIATGKNIQVIHEILAH